MPHNDDDTLPVNIAAAAGADLVIVVLIAIGAATLMHWVAILGVGP